MTPYYIFLWDAVLSSNIAKELRVEFVRLLAHYQYLFLGVVD